MPELKMYLTRTDKTGRILMGGYEEHPQTERERVIEEGQETIDIEDLLEIFGGPEKEVFYRARFFCWYTRHDRLLLDQLEIERLEMECARLETVTAYDMQCGIDSRDEKIKELEHTVEALKRTIGMQKEAYDTRITQLNRAEFDNLIKIKQLREENEELTRELSKTW
jgi:hypothetical protein